METDTPFHRVKAPPLNRALARNRSVPEWVARTGIRCILLPQGIETRFGRDVFVAERGTFATSQGSKRIRRAFSKSTAPLAFRRAGGPMYEGDLRADVSPEGRVTS
jgi:hypothetical protein